jgi:hypothetical protein
MDLPRLCDGRGEEMKKLCIGSCMVLLGVGALSRLEASGHGPVFGLATPVNAQGVCNIDLALMDSQASAGGNSMARTLFGCGITENFQLSVSVPAVFSSQPLAPSRFTGLMPMTSDIESIAEWRFFRRDTGVGSRIEATAIGGVIAPGPQRMGGMLGGLHRSPGVYSGITAGMASRSHYAWVGVSYSRFGESHDDRRPDLLFFSAAYAYRPAAWRTDYPRWDWRLFAEMTAERAGPIVKAGADLPATLSHQVYLGPSVLGTYKNYAVSAGIQFPVYRDASGVYRRELFRVSANLTYYFSLHRSDK